MAEFNFWTQINRDASQRSAFGQIANVPAVVAEANASPIVQVDIDGNLRKQALYDWSLYDQDFFS